MAQFSPYFQGDFVPSGGGSTDSVGPPAGYTPSGEQPMGPSANPSAGLAGFNNPNAPSFQSRPAQDPQMAAANSGPSFFNGSNWNPTYQSNAGYNPSQYATQDTANTLAGALGSGLGLGANVRQTQNAPGSPIGPPPQQMLDFGGQDMLNAGLMAERYKKYDHATADRMTRDELGLMGQRQAPNADSQGGSMGSWSQYGASPGGSQNLGGGQNIGQFIGERAGGAFGSPGSTTPQSPISPNSQNPLSYVQQTPGATTGSNPYPFQPSPQTPQQPQFGQRGNYGGFGTANNFQSANQGSQIQQLLQMLMGGQGGMFQTRGRSSPYGSGGQMSGYTGLPSFLQQYNQSAGNGRSPFQSGSMSGLAGMVNRVQNPQPQYQGPRPGGGMNFATPPGA